MAALGFPNGLRALNTIPFLEIKVNDRQTANILAAIAVSRSTLNQSAIPADVDSGKFS